MKLKLIFLFIIFLNSASQAQNSEAPVGGQTPHPVVVRPRGLDDTHKESSSFMGDADSTDVMPTKRENLKEDDEPVLEDIRQVLDAPSEKKNKAPKPKVVKAKPEVKQPQEKQEKTAPAAKSYKTKNKKTAVAKSKKKNDSNFSQTNLAGDDPDLGLERKFNTLYKKYNAEPTSAEIWGAAVGKSSSQVYVVQKGDTLWTISKTLFADPNFWPKIWSLNRMGIMNPHVITPGLKVHFYAGSGFNVPTLALSGQNSEENQNVDLDGNDSSVSKLNPTVPAGVIPDSIPLYRNDTYHLPRKDLVVELPKDVQIQEKVINDVFLASREMQSQIEIPMKEMIKGSCGSNFVIQLDKAVNPGQIYRIFETLEELNTDVGNVYAYRIVGQAKALSDKKIKITACTTVMSEKLVYLSEDSIEQYRLAKTSKINKPQILGGPNLGTQSLFSNPKQLVYLNMGTQPVSVGQMLEVRSQITEEPSGEIRILESYGSFSIGLITEVSDLIEKDDEIVLK